MALSQKQAKKTGKPGDDNGSTAFFEGSLLGEIEVAGALSRFCSYGLRLVITI